MDYSDDIAHDLITPWVETEVQYNLFQEWFFVHEETAKVIAIEEELGPHEGSPVRYQITLLPSDYEENTAIEKIIEDGFVSKTEALHEAEALMATNKVLDA